MTITSQQSKRIYQLCGYDKETKMAVVSQFTGAPDLVSTKDLTHAQANAVICHLGGVPIGKKCWGSFDYKKQSHRYVLSLCRQLGWTRETAGKGTVADLERLGNWLESKLSPVQKPLLQMSPTEVSTIINAMESMVGKEYSK